MVSKRDLGIGYLIGTGLGLIFGLIGHALLTDNSVVVTVTETTITIAASVLLIYIGYWLRRSSLSDEHVWSVARWGTVGLGVPMAISLVITVFGLERLLAFVSPTMLVNNIGAGGLVGVLFGTVVQLHREHTMARDLNQRNLVLNRVLRHNIRNDMNVIIGYAEELENQLNGNHEEVVEPIQRKAKEVVELSKSAREIESIDADARWTPVDAADVVGNRTANIRDIHPEAEIDVDLPDEAWIGADPLFESVVDNVVENAIVHNDRRPEVAVSVERHNEVVEFRVADNGPGIPAEESTVLSDDGETPLRHGTGLGLWLVKLFVDAYDGELAFEDNEPRGSVVVVRLPRVEPRDDPGQKPTDAG